MTNPTQNALTPYTLTPAQQAVLEAAAGRTDGSIHPVPNYLKGGAAKKVIRVLRAKSLIDDSVHNSPVPRQKLIHHENANIFQLNMIALDAWSLHPNHDWPASSSLKQ